MDTYVSHFLSKLPRGSLHAKLFSWGQAKDEAKVDVNEMTMSVHHHIAVVSAKP